MADRVGAVFAALADPTRRAIIDRLARGDASVGELAAPFEMSQPAVSKHLRVLEDAGLISRTRVATTRYSTLRAEPLREASEWMGRYRRFWNEGFDKLDSVLAAHQASVSVPEPAADPELAADSVSNTALETDSVHESDSEPARAADESAPSQEGDLR